MTIWSDAVTALAPYSWYKLDEASGTTLTDSGSAPVNGVTASSNITHNQATIIPGDTGGKSKITANGGQIDTGNLTTDRAGTGYTMSWSYKGTTANIAGNGRMFNGGGVDVGAGATNFELRALGSDTTTRTLCPRATVLTGTAVHLVLVIKSGDQRFYVNGALQATFTTVPGVAPTGTGVTRFARAGGSDYLSGQYDDLTFIAGALTEPQVTSLYNAWLGVTTQNIAIGRVTEIDTARSVTATAGEVTVPIGRVTETDVARSITVIQDQTVALGRVTETDVARSILVNQQGSYWTFEPPTRGERSDDFFFGRYDVQVGITLIKRDGHFEEVPYPWMGDLDGLEDGVEYFLGGHVYTDIDSAVAAQLVADGYSPILEFV